MTSKPLFQADSAVAERQPKTDRLVLDRLLREKASDRRLDEKALRLAHQILVKWADLETSGRLARLKETQMQGDFLAEVFGQALGYAGPVDGAPVWQRLQHHAIAGETPDAVLGHFGPGRPVNPLVIVELKGPMVHLDRDRSNGRTAVEQCWDYLTNTPPECRWGIVSNYVSFRLYERNLTRRRYEHFTLQSLRNFDTFRCFYALFHREGLIDGWMNGPPRAVELLERTNTQQRDVGDKLYQTYSEHRLELIAYLHFKLHHPLQDAIEMAQRLLDRIMFIAFCEDRRLLPEKTIPQAYAVAGFHAVTNPRWQNFKNLFRFLDEGQPQYNIDKFNGGLFAKHPVDDLELPDVPWTEFFKSISTYDFADEVNLDVLGHLFEQSITELEKIKQTGLFGGNAEKAHEFAMMPQSAKRKRLGIYYTPPDLTSLIVKYTVEELIRERLAALAEKFGVAPADARRGIMPDAPDFWQAALDTLRALKIVDPACGSGAFLFQAYNVLEQAYLEIVTHLPSPVDDQGRRWADRIPHFILTENLYGVDLSPEAVEIAQLAMWIRSAAPGQTLEHLSRNIVHGNSLVHDPSVHPSGFDWKERFPEVFNRAESGFDCVIGNPPWERIKLQEREFFSLLKPEIATATNAARRRQMVAKLESADPALYARYQEALASAETLLNYCRSSGAYPLTGQGDVNTYAVFAELAYQLVAPHGRVGLLTPSGIASDKTTKDFFAAIAESNRLIRLYDFENRLKRFFPDVDNRFKFCILNFGGSAATTGNADFVFFAHRVEDLEDSRRHIPLSGADIKLLNPNTRTCPIFRTKRDAAITKAIYRRVPILIDRNRKGPTGNPWGVKFLRMFDQTNDAELFHEAAALKEQGFKREGNRWRKGKRVMLPLYEAKMVQAYDHRAASVVVDRSNWMRQGQTEKTTLVDHQNPEFTAQPRFWVQADSVDLSTTGSMGFKDITSPTNQRTMIAAWGPLAGYTNHFVLLDGSTSERSKLCLLGNLNSFVYDYCVRQKIGGVTLNFFIVEQVPTLSPDVYAKRCPWAKRETLEHWISERVLKLTCTAVDMLPLAEACDFKSGSFQSEYGGRLHKWDEADRAVLLAELDAAFFHLYGLDRGDVEYILSTFTGIRDRGTLVPDQDGPAELILRKYAELAGST